MPEPFAARGVVLIPSDFTFSGWPDAAASAGLNVIGLHVTGGPPSVLTSFLETGEGQSVLERCRGLGLSIEYELHALVELLPRGLFGRNPAMFRMNEAGDRVSDCNLCPSSGDALEVIGENAVALARKLTPTTHRYYYWSDDGQPWCHCPRCRGLNDADQSLIATNAMLRALRRLDPQARIAGLAYHSTLTPPTQVRPDEGVFLEFAPIERRWDQPITDSSIDSHARLLDALDAAIATFGVDEHAQVLEYWMDASRHSHWKRPAVQIPWHPEVLQADLEFYAGKGFRRVTSFACWIDQEYIERYDVPPIAGYGAALNGRPPGG
jgi:Domain of unknown function (DUF4838)